MKTKTNATELKRLKVRLIKVESEYNAALLTFKKSSAMSDAANSLASNLEYQRDEDEKNLQKTYAKVQVLHKALDSEKQAKIYGW